MHRGSKMAGCQCVFAPRHKSKRVAACQTDCRTLMLFPGNLRTCQSRRYCISTRCSCSCASALVTASALFVFFRTSNRWNKSKHSNVCSNLAILKMTSFSIFSKQHTHLFHPHQNIFDKLSIAMPRNCSHLPFAHIALRSPHLFADHGCVRN